MDNRNELLYAYLENKIEGIRILLVIEHHVDGRPQTTVKYKVADSDLKEIIVNDIELVAWK